MQNLPRRGVKGYNKSKREYFYGLKATVITSRDGCPFRIILCPGSEHDSVPFKLMKRNLPYGSEIFGDSAYLVYAHKDKLLVEEKVRLITEPKSNSLGL